MKKCLTCHWMASDNDATCMVCGEGSWAPQTVDTPVKAAAAPAAEQPQGERRDKRGRR